MTLAASLERLVVAGDGVADALCAARVTACEDQPAGASTLAVDELAEAMVELAGEAQALRDRIRAVVLGPTQPSVAEASNLVSLAGRAWGDIVDALASRVVSCERRSELDRAARRGGAQWRGWWAATARGLRECEPPLRELRDAVFACWRELAEVGSRRIEEGPADPARSGGDSPARVPIGVTAHGDLTGRVVFRTLADESGGGRER
jgi:hypothetical protein